MDPLPHRETGLQSLSESQGPKWEPGSLIVEEGGDSSRVTLVQIRSKIHDL